MQTGRMKRMLAVFLTAAVFTTGMIPAEQVQAKTRKPWYLDLKVTVPTEAQLESRGNSVPDDSGQIEGIIGGRGTVPASYMNSLDQINALYPQTRDQGAYPTCWAFSSIGLMEFDLIRDDKIADKSIDLSERHLVYFTYHNAADKFGGTDGDKLTLTMTPYQQAGGSLYYSSRTLLQWEGAVKENVFPYRNIASKSPIAKKYAHSKAVAHLQDAYIINIHKHPDAVKKEIMQHGSAGISYFAGDDYETTYDKMAYYNGEMVSTFYCPTTDKANHGVNIVGWDDNFPAENFVNRPKGNGAWLVRNSWGVGNKNDLTSYFWISYYDRSIEKEAWIFDCAPAGKYDYIYQYDGCPLVGKAFTTKKSANVFKVKGSSKQTLKAVSITLNEDANVPYTIYIYKNLKNKSKPTSGKLAATVNGKTSYAGTYTIPLKKSVKLSKGSRYSIVVKLGKSGAGIDAEYSYSYSGIQAQASIDFNQSFIFYEGKWRDIAELDESYGVGNLCIKGYTKKTGN